MSKKLLVSTTVFLLLITTISATAIAQNGVPPSTALQTVIDQAAHTFTSSADDWNRQIATQPLMIATYLGLIVQRQQIHMRQSKKTADVPRLHALNEEVEAMLAEIAKMHNYRDPEDGSDMPTARLLYTYGSARNGEMNTMIASQAGFDVRTINVPYMLSLVNLPTNPGDTGGGIHGKLQMKKKNEINLLGEVSPAAVSPYPDNAWLYRYQMRHGYPKKARQSNP